MSKNQEVKHKSFYSILGKIGDILLWPVLIISLFSSFFMLVQKKQNKVTSIFGYSFVNVLSGSMVNSGFLINDTVMVKSINERDIKLGDVIAFYYTYENKSSADSDMHLVIEYKNPSYPISLEDDNIYKTDINVDDYVKTEDKKEEYLKKAQDSKSKVYFHQVVAIYVNNAGEMFFKTKGSSNNSSDTYLIRGDVVVGRYVTTPVVVRRVVSFCASPIGMILLVCFPLSMLVLMQSLSLIEQISIIELEKKLMSGKLSYTDDDIVKGLKPDQIELYNKVYFYYVTPEEQKPEVKNFLWGDVLNKEELTDKQLIEKVIIEDSIKKLEKSDNAYWNAWIENSKGANKRKLLQYKNKLLTISKIVNENQESVEKQEDVKASETKAKHPPKKPEM